MSSQKHYIDIHSHILPGVDDGAGSMEQTVRMLRIAAGEQINTMIATPHYEAGRDNPSVEHLRNIRNQVQEEALRIRKDFRIFLGNELYYSESVVEALNSGEALTLAGSRYVLVEFNYGIDFNSMYRGINDFVYNGYIPILAHIERYDNVYREPDRIRELIKMGCYIQMNSDSLMGGFLDMEAAYNRKLLSHNLVHFVGSDSHSDRVRAPMMEAVVKHLLKKCDEGLIERVFIENPNKILENTYI